MAQEPLVTFEEHPPITVGLILSTSVLDALNVTQFGNQVLAHIQGRTAVKLLLSFERVNYLSSAVLTELLRINEAVRELQGQLRLCALNSDIRKVFEITNLDRIFVIYGAPDEA
ncbi:MAG: STAS domain-containing protein, partial [FCB group bacterium]|nr:STAS domain-containing protein [FCB group bacterium]